MKCQDTLLGGVGHIVEIDESALTSRKYHRGKAVKRGGVRATTWILGMIDQETRESVIYHVHKRDAKTLIPLIQKHVKPLSIIWTDCWKAYSSLDNLGYIHETVNHSTNFKSETDVCTNLIEGHWRVLKMYLRSKNVLSSKFLFEYVDEFLWAQKFGFDPYSKFQNMLSHIREKYAM